MDSMPETRWTLWPDPTQASTATRTTSTTDSGATLTRERNQVKSFFITKQRSSQRFQLSRGIFLRACLNLQRMFKLILDLRNALPGNSLFNKNLAAEVFILFFRQERQRDDQRQRRPIDDVNDVETTSTTLKRRKESISRFSASTTRRSATNQTWFLKKKIRFETFPCLAFSTFLKNLTNWFGSFEVNVAKNRLRSSFIQNQIKNFMSITRKQNEVFINFFNRLLP